MQDHSKAHFLSVFSHAMVNLKLGLNYIYFYKYFLRDYLRRKDFQAFYQLG